MNRGIVAGLLVVSFMLGSGAWAKKEKTGVLEKDLFSDTVYGYQLTVPYNWRLKTEKEPSLLRATLQKAKLENLPAGGGQGYYDGTRFIPTVTVIADTTSLSLERFGELLLEAKGHLPNEKQYLMKMELLLQSTLESQQKVKVAGLDGIKYTLQKKYLKVVSDPRQRVYGTSKEVTVEESLLGYMVVFKNQNRVFIVQCVGERATFQFEDKEYQKLWESWKFKT